MVGLRAGTYPLRRRCAREQAAAPEPAVATDLTMIRFWVTACSLVAMLALCVAAVAEERDIVITRENQRTNFTDAEIVDGFFKIVLGAEYHVAGRVDGVRKYDKPVRVYIDSRTKPDRRKQVAAVIADIRAKVKHLDIAVSFYGRERAKEIQRSLEPQCLSGFRKDETLRIQRSDVILVVDAGELIFYDCAYEEILQGLGPINDDDGIPWTMFNDDVQMGFFGVYDQYILNLLYHPRVKPGMKDREIREMLPTVLPEVRRWVAEVNGLKPQ
jgi:hypothetical protein